MKTSLALCFLFILTNIKILMADQPELLIREKIKPFFKPPKEYKHLYGDYRSPLVFYNGEKVKSPADWGKRRTEILTAWNGMMGEWPALIKNQKIEILETSQKEGYIKKRIRFNWRPDEKNRRLSFNS